MFGWRKRRDGFEWQSYVRTTILMRRKERRRKVRSAMEAASEQLAEAGRRGSAAGVSGLRFSNKGLQWMLAEAGVFATASWTQIYSLSGKFIRAAGEFLVLLGQQSVRLANIGFTRGAHFAVFASGTAWSGIKRGSVTGADFASVAARSMWHTLKHVSVWAANFVVHCTKQAWYGLQLLIELIADRGLALYVAIAGVVILLVSTALILSQGAAVQNILPGLFSLFALGIAAVAALQSRAHGQRVRASAQLPNVRQLLSGMAGNFSWLKPVRFSHASSFARVAAVASCLVILCAAAWWGIGIAGSQNTSFASVWGPSGDIVKGRAKVLSGDTLRIKGNIIKLSGVDAPERRQKCSRPGAKRWACGERARKALRRVVGRRTITCEVSEKNALGLRDGACRVKDKDIAALMVRKGYAFSSGGWFTKYASLEAEAKQDTAGLWRGTAQRPEAYRAERWEDASAKAPEGCPIKGRVLSRRKKVYVLPWSRSYERTKVRPRRGERWFCSEGEALRAGWKPSEHS